jgi:benzoate membrane transport protein
MPLDAPKDTAAEPASFFGALSAGHVANAVVALVFATTGPIAIMLAVAAKGGMSEPQIASWMFGGFFVNGLVSLAFSLYFRQPLVMLWSIPGVVLAGPALVTYSLPQVVGAYLGCGLLMLVLGLTGWVRRAMQAVPMPIVMGMVAGVFLKFALDWIAALSSNFGIAGPMTLVYLILLAVPPLARRAPPLIVALLVGLAAAYANGLFQPDLATTSLLARPILVWPDFSLAAMIELVVPFTIAVLVVQNGQGMAVLQAAGHTAPLNAIAVACGAASLVSGLTGAVNTCLTGPLSAILTDRPDRENHYTAAVVASVLLTLFGVFAPLFTRLLLACPTAVIATLGGLAMLKVLESAFVTAFRGKHTLGALVTFLVTISGITIANIGAPFWGLVLGFCVSRLIEREHFDAAS